ncbi:hypothetical protein ACFX13_013062 [Malus domestica]|uniref:UspA domain-containing protein n=1 Tax=Malus domestica TaxID=3750 RepID=A0A498I8A3_MALDO|nr:uncharacterized protein LOC114820502 [Malus domestica]XP_050120183.1 uncharacterized protein LOC126597425 [Malus sylvestris]RXH78432.1 hypothetical protein DVH24_001950 [Malus domestica]
MDFRHNASPRRIMVVADPTQESAGALQYALSKTVSENDELILFHVENPNSWRYTITMFLKRPRGGSATVEGGLGNTEFLEEMKNACKHAKPKVRVRVEKVALMEGKDKASIILDQSKVLGVDVLVIGQRRSLSTVILGYRRPGGSTRGTKPIDTAEYLIDKSSCTCVGVQKKGQNGGYLLNTKTHKNFWLLA